MARTPFNKVITTGSSGNPGVSYTVPAGKYLICAAHIASSASSGVALQVDGQTTIPLGGSADSATSSAPLVFVAGQVLSSFGVSASKIFLTGFLYDVE